MITRLASEQMECACCGYMEAHSGPHQVPRQGSGHPCTKGSFWWLLNPLNNTRNYWVNMLSGVVAGCCPYDHITSLLCCVCKHHRTLGLLLHYFCILVEALLGHIPTGGWGEQESRLQPFCLREKYFRLPFYHTFMEDKVFHKKPMPAAFSFIVAGNV